MFSSLAKLFESKLADRSDAPASREDALRVATAALLIEVARADFEESGRELKTVEALLRERFSLRDDEARDLIEAAQSASDQSASLYRFTHAVHEHLSDAEKQHVIAMLWRVALADARLDKYEDALMHKIAELIYVSHGTLMAIKSRVKEELQAAQKASGAASAN
ncbi:MAG TPA: TerB family tellurite resistance protein [Gammaproteobacteria bacterium]|nr:TerB family tellurite resistance protein [Gammaproteobacteria bacterium]